jgi:hypothetical protein
VKAVTPSKRLRFAAAAVALAVPALSSCSSNFNAPTDQVYTPGVGVNDRSGTIDVLHALIVSGEDGSGTVIAGLVNNDQEQPDTLADVAGAGDDQAITVSSGDAQVEIPAGGFVQLADEGNISVTATQIQPGKFVELTFSFANSESVNIEVPVVENTGEFADVPLPSAS